MAEALDEMRPQLTEIDQENKQLLIDGGMELIEYDDAFFDEALAVQGVKDLYQRIDSSTNGLATVLQDSLEQAAAG